MLYCGRLLHLFCFLNFLVFDWTNRILQLIVLSSFSLYSFARLKVYSDWAGNGMQECVKHHISGNDSLSESIFVEIALVVNNIYCRW